MLFVTSFTTKGNTEIFFDSTVEERVATDVVDSVTAEGAGSLDVDDDSTFAAGNSPLNPFSFCCRRRLTVFAIVEVKEIKKREPNCLRERLPDVSTSRNMSAMYALFPLRS